jgi:hypothetical protein
MSDTIHIMGEEGVIFKMTPEMLTEPIADRLARGYLKRVNADGSPYVEKVERTQPAPYAPKAEWVGWAVHVSQATDSPISPDDADALTKQDLIEMYGVNIPKK